MSGIVFVLAYFLSIFNCCNASGHGLFRSKKSKREKHHLLKKQIMKRLQIFFLLAFASFQFPLSAQSIVGNWQLVKQGSCLDESAANNREDDLENLRKEMHSRTPVTPQVVSFKKNATGRESSRILNSNSTVNSKKFYYKFSSERLLILDKRSQTISESYMVDKFTADSLIVSNSSRPCETRIFVKITDD